MAEAAPATGGNEARRRAMLQAAAELISERGFGETRVADVARRAGTSSGLVMYYFGTRERLLVDAMRFSEEAYYETATGLLTGVGDIRTRLEMLTEWSCVPGLPGEVSGSWGLWLEVWATALRHPEVREAREDLDRRWRGLVEQVVKDGVHDGDLPAGTDARGFALAFTLLLDALSTQVALGDTEITSDVAYDMAMEYAEQRLGLLTGRRRARRRSKR